MSTSNTTVKTNPRGIPAAPFVTNVEEYVGGPDAEVETPLNQFQERLAKYKYMEGSLTQRRRSLEEKIPDIRKTLDMVLFLRERRDSKGKSKEGDDLDGDLDGEDSQPQKLLTTFELNDTLYAQAELVETDVVYLWLGANTMLSYTLAAAESLLKSKLESAEISLRSVIEDLEFIREQVTVMEVNCARVFNWDVVRRRQRREQGTNELKD